MEQERRSIRWGLAVLAAAVTLELLLSGALDRAVAWLVRPEVASVLLYLETGRVTRPAPPISQPTEVPEETAAPTVPAQPLAPARPVFAPEDLELVSLQNATGYQPDLEALLLSPLEWQLTGEQPTVLILHTHATESYTQSEGCAYTPSSYYRTLEEQYNVTRVGAHLAQCLQDRGIRVLHDTTYHDYPAYTGSYSNSRKTVRDYLEEDPSICLVLDIHRDALEDDGGHQLPAALEVRGETVAQLMLVMGTDAGSLHHPDWQQNLALALKLHTQLERRTPGLCRPIQLRRERFNQDLSAGALLVEVGAAGNTLPQALAAAELLAEAVASLAWGAAIENSAS